MMSKVFPLHCEAKSYAWGKRGSSSTVAQLLMLNGISIDEETPYAELWMGTHPSGPSKIQSSSGNRHLDRLLADELKANPKYLGQNVSKKFDGEGLPFLFKVLSVRTPLSIQAHPDKARAEELHTQRPDLYSDPNHKPEMAVALTEFRALCGFRPFRDILAFVRDVPELRTLVGVSNLEALQNAASSDSVELQKAALKQSFTAVMTSSKEAVKAQLELLVAKLETCNTANDETSQLIVEVHKEFPADVGCLAIYFLNYLRMQPGQALFLGANEAHAYLSGDCIEIMACSDNVVRAGLTPKFIDVQELCRMLTYDCSSAESRLFHGVRHPESFSTVLDPPVPDFSLARMEVPATTKTYTFPVRDSGSIILVVHGQATYELLHDSAGPQRLSRGSVIFVPADEKLTIDIPATSPDLLAFQAYCQL